MNLATHTAYISVGSNIGDGRRHCENGIAALEKSGVTAVTDRSRFYLTEPVDCADQDWFVNGVVKIQTTYDPFGLFEKIVSIQRDEGRREKRIRFGPRILDMDILLYDDDVVQSSVLVIPHPRMHKRRFVLKPICDIDPDVVHPVLHRSMQQLLTGLGDNEQRIVYIK
jgi:2-amino-4-hydroxy-6-hydroxymethyldihydropteridine diphosphokinase